MYEYIAEQMLVAAKRADAWVKKIYEMDFSVEIKDDNSPVTDADKGADEIIRAYLGTLFPEAGFLTDSCVVSGKMP